MLAVFQLILGVKLGKLLNIHVHFAANLDISWKSVFARTGDAGHVGKTTTYQVSASDRSREMGTE